MAQVDDVELGVGSRARPRLRGRVAELRDYRERRVSNFFGNCAGIADRLGIAVAPSRSRPESTRACVAASRGGPRDRDLEEGFGVNVTSRVRKIGGQNCDDRITVPRCIPRSIVARLFSSNIRLSYSRRRPAYARRCRGIQQWYWH